MRTGWYAHDSLVGVGPKGMKKKNPPGQLLLEDFSFTSRLDYSTIRWISRLIIVHSPVFGSYLQFAKHFQFFSSMSGVSAR